MRKTRNNHTVRGQRPLRAISLFTLIAAMTIGFMNTSPIRAQSQTAPATAPAMEYEVATIKPNNSNDPPAVLTADDGIDFRNIPLGILLGIAFGVSNDRIIGGPQWLNDRYDINAKMDAPVADALKKLNPLDRRAARQHMMQALLIDRCKIAFHRDTKELPVFLLVVAKGGPKLQEGKPADASPEGVGGTGTLQFGAGGLMTFKAMPLSSLTLILSQQLGRAVLDKTGLVGRYDFTWQFNQGANAGAGRGGASPAGSADSEPASIFTVVQEELGLKLDSGKGPVEVIVIDHMERPSGN
jgi:uncharacterized protein (TIGR03435 family)